MCGNLGLEHVGHKVCIMGFVSKVRDLGGVIFIDLRDITGITQVVVHEEKMSNIENVGSLGREFVIAVSGEVVKRSDDTVNKNISTGEIELMADCLEILSKAKTPPFYIEENTDTNEQVRLKYRYLDLRRPDMQRNLILRHKAAKIIRNYLDENNFFEIETPMLTRSTPEGARDYLVPSRVHKGAFYALPQSPQQYKQLLMLAGMDRYFQIVRCFRDEDLRADRQPEFTQIDLEMSFVDAEDVISLNEGLIKEIFKNLMNYDVKIPIPRITYKEAMEKYGVDKPDARFELHLVDLSKELENCGFNVFSGAIKNGGSVRGIRVPGGAEKFSRRDLDSLVDFVKIYGAKGLAWIFIESDGYKSPITKFLSEDEINSVMSKMKAKTGDLLLFVADEDSIVFDSLGNLRLEIARRLDIINENQLNFVWVTEFPLLEYDKTEKRYVAKHHPFTAPMDEDVHLLETDIEKVRAKAYDIVLNGVELGGGSIRIHSTEFQEKMFGFLGFSKEEAWEKFGFLMDAFGYGTPPHGGIAYGFDRLMMIITGSSSIREVIAFPKVQNASELMTNAPSAVSKSQLQELNIKNI